VIDLDRKHGKNGVRAFERLHGCHPDQFDAPQVITATAGLHVYTDPTGRDFKNSVSIIATALCPDTVPVGQMRRVEQVDQNGLKIVSWIGQESFVKDMTRPGRRVVNFHTDHGFVDASGRPLR